MKCAFLYNSKHKNEILMINLKHIEKELIKIYGEVDIVGLNSIESVKNFYKDKASNYDYVIHSGGDGTFNLICNYIVLCEKKPIIGYMPTGTACDNAKKYGMSKKFNKTLAIYRENNIKSVEVMKVNNFYVGYVLSKGKFVRVSYDTNRVMKKILGSLAYLFRGVKEFFRRVRFEVELTIDNKKISDNYSLIIITNSSSIGGFRIRKKYEEDVINVYTFKKSVFSIALFFLFKEKAIRLSKNAQKYQGKNVKVKTIKANDNEWSFDGERIDCAEYDISIAKNHFNLLVAKDRL